MPDSRLLLDDQPFAYGRPGIGSTTRLAGRQQSLRIEFKEHLGALKALPSEQ